MVLKDLRKDCIDAVHGLPCKICNSNKIEFIGTKFGQWSKKSYKLFRCPNCGFAFVGNPRTDYENIYDMAYYGGEGADPKVDYLFEFEHPDRTSHLYEWEGIAKAVISIRKSVNQPLDKNTRWLDFGCGVGGLVRWLQEKVGCQVFGFDESPIVKLTYNKGIRILNHDELLKYKGTFDVVTAIEVIEHTVDPIEILKQIRFIMKPGGIFFFTTGNAHKFKKDIINWSYVIPEVHISFFEPRTMAYALSASGFEPLWPEKRDGFKDIITYKILKSLGVQTRSGWQKIIPWSIITWIVDKRYGVTSFPIGRAI